jgi:ribosomal protein S27AE
MTAFRSTLSSCPRCQQPLREHAQRMVCDSCQGMLVTSDDLATSIHELGATTTTELEARDLEPATALCPRCGNAMQSCTLRLGTHELKGRFLRCEADGIWLSQEQLVGELARGSRKGHAGGRSGLSSAANAFAAVAPQGSAAAAAAGVGRAFTQNQRTPIGYRAPRVRIAFVSAFKGRELACPACAKQLAFRGDQWVCSDCAGTFVENAALVAMVQEITQAYWEIPASTGTQGPRACPACSAPMTVDKHESVEIDRCAKDGVWFDETELAALLLDTTTQPKSTGGWLRRLFGG